jgi:hypothetical protein
MFKRISWAVLLFLAIAGAAPAAVNSVAGLANPLDNAGVSARALAMGSAFVGVADDSSALLWNSAGLGGLRDPEIALHHNSWLAGILQETAVGVMPLGRLGGVGLSVNYVNYGTFAGYDANGERQGDYSANRFGFGLGWGKEFIPGLSAGAAIKGAMRNVDNNSSSDASADFGALWAPLPGLRLGVDVANLGTKVDGYNQALDIRVGASYLHRVAADNRLLLAASGTVEPQGVNRLHVGAEDLIHNFLALRIGYQANLAETQIQGLSGLTAGGGISFSGLGLDYAFLPYGDLGAAHRVSLSYKFGQAGMSPAAGN